MNLKEHYNKLYNDSIDKIKTNNYQIDNLINAENDDRFGLTLLIRPDNNVKEKITNFLDKLRSIEPHQYYYPASDMHVTVMSIISCYSGFSLEQIDVEDYIGVIKNGISGFTNFDIEFRGLTASSSCVMAKGFFKKNALNSIRDSLRKNFKASNFQQSIDKRYSIQTAHSTIFRIGARLDNKHKFLQLLEEYKYFHFGTFRVDTLELVFNDWYQRKENVKTLYEFRL